MNEDRLSPATRRFLIVRGRENFNIVFDARSETAVALSASWDALNAWAFVTIYKRAPPTSKNVFGCVSAGNHDGREPAIAINIVSAAKRSRKDRRRFEEDGSEGPRAAYEVTLLASRMHWIRRQRSEMSRARQRTYFVSPDGSPRSGAFYLPSVWDERPTLDVDNYVAVKPPPLAATIERSPI